MLGAILWFTIGYLAHKYRVVAKLQDWFITECRKEDEEEEEL
jgi:hypothetical protein